MYGRKRALVLVLSILGLAGQPGLAGVNPQAGSALVVSSVEPEAHSLVAPVDSEITIRFDKPVKPASVTVDSFWAFARWSGTVSGSFAFSDLNQSVTLRPDRRFSAGESVMVFLSEDIEAEDGSFLRSAGYSFQFWTRALPAPLEFEEIARLTVQTPPSFNHTQAYGGIGSDLDRDGFLDITIVNEVTADLRVLLNRADGTGLFDGVIEPTFALGVQASPSEPADFDHDGIVDICVANISDGTVSVLLGNGDGTFAPQQTIPVGAQPRGIAVLDVDGDGDVDIVNTNSQSAGVNMSIHINDGTGLFPASALPSFSAGAVNPWGLGAADMNNDGILDIVIGARSSATMVVQTGNGDGTFSFASSQASGGSIWMLVIGDVDGDGDEDVATANSFSSSASLLRGDGLGNLAPPQLIVADSFAIATDLGDLDGDGDLDWVTSSFSGDWRLNVNDGDGNFSIDQLFSASGPSEASSCALMMDVDNDGDLDLALIDEVADEIRIMQNGGIGPIVIPVTSGWGLVAMGSLMAIGGWLLIRQREQHAGQTA